MPKRINTHICGEGGPLDEFNPSVITRKKHVPELLYLLNKTPLSITEICLKSKITRENALEIVKDLLRIKAVEEKSGRYHINFAIFLRKDLKIIARATEKTAELLANRIIFYKDKIVRLAEHFSSARQVEMEKILFAVVGCFILDWQCLDVMIEQGLLIKNKPQPGLRNYLLFGQEELDEEDAAKFYDAMYWGSHSDQSENHVFTSFGDHTGLRYALPDILNYIITSKTFYERIRLPLWFNEKLTEAARLNREIILKETAHILLEINVHGPILEKKFVQEISKGAATTNVVAFLKDMNYLTCERGVLKLNYPVFVVGEKRVIQQIADIVVPLAVQIVQENYLKIKRALCSLTPVKNNVSFEEIFNEVWHWIFAKTNKTLAEKGFFYNPPRKREIEARYMARISEFDYP